MTELKSTLNRTNTDLTELKSIQTKVYMKKETKRSEETRPYSEIFRFCLQTGGMFPPDVSGEEFPVKRFYFRKSIKSKETKIALSLTSVFFLMKLCTNFLST